MRRTAPLAALGLALAALVAPANAQSATVDLGPGVGGFMSPNLSYVATIPTDSPGVGARVVNVGGQKRFYVSSSEGLRIYDVTSPGLPILMGAVELPHWENEDVTVSRDGKTILMSEFTGTYMHVFTVTDLPGGKLAITPTGFTPGPAGHIVDCIDDACNVVYGAEGHVIDLKDKANPKVLTFNWATSLGLPTNGHNVEIDAAGILWADVTPITAIDVSNPLKPRILAQASSTDMAAKKTAYQHNTKRPAAGSYKPRVSAEEIATPFHLPGELLLSNGETNFGPQCSGSSGPFATYSMKGLNLDGKTVNAAKPTSSANTFKTLDVFRPLNGTYDGDGNPAVNAVGCSGHWFSTNEAVNPGRITVAAGWYEHGTRILDVDPATGKITQKGYFQPVAGSASATHWISDEYVYVVDYVRGIDILKYNKNAPVPTQEQFDASWLAKLDVVEASSELSRFICSEGRFAARDADAAAVVKEQFGLLG